jgi:hypothetical protein
MKIVTKKSMVRLGLLAIFLGVLGVLGWYLMLRMPGESFQGELPALNDEETDLVADLKRDVQLLAGDIGERNTVEYDALLRTEEFLTRSLEREGYEVERQEFDSGGITVANLIAETEGGLHKDQILVVGAHYDTVGSCPGANDNGTGVAALLALARVYADRSTDRTIRFVLFVNEEPPWFKTEQMGSLVYAKACAERGDDIRGMLSLETMGCYSDEAGSQDYPFPFGLFYPDKGNFISFVGNFGSRSLVRNAVRAFRKVNRFPSEGGALPGFIPGVGWSDHWSFWQAGFPAIMVTDTAPFRYAHYHMTTDTADQVDYERLARVTAALVPVLHDLSRGD